MNDECEIGEYLLFAQSAYKLFKQNVEKSEGSGAIVVLDRPPHNEVCDGIESRLPLEIGPFLY